ncbi:MAG: efflux RND transporter periplasmic adaptor subunit, partial [Burkholderiales bacterium]
MQVRKFFPALLTGLLVVAGYAWYHYSSGSSTQPTATEAAATVEPGLVRYPPGAPQLQFIAVQGVVLLPEPLLEPLNGRVAYDENYTARVAAPIAGRVVKLEAQPGDTVKVGQALAWLDAPEYAAAVADVQKSTNDVRLKARSFQRAKEMVEAA